MLSRPVPPTNNSANPDEPASSGRPDFAPATSPIASPKFPRIAPNDSPVESDSIATAPRSNDVILWLRRTDQWLLGIMLFVLLVLLIAFRWKLAGAGRGEIEVSSQLPREYYYAIEINSATWVEWSQLDGIGQKLAKRIVQDRDERGPFQSVEEISRVRGLGPRLVDRLRPFLKCDRIKPDPSDESPLKEPH